MARTAMVAVESWRVDEVGRMVGVGCMEAGGEFMTAEQKSCLGKLRMRLIAVGQLMVGRFAGVLCSLRLLIDARVF
jgi:hypothetical protein